MPQQYVQIQDQGFNADPLMLNMAENVRYRRMVQQRKAQQALTLETQMAQGAIPQGSFDVGEEGFDFDSEQAKKAYFDSVGKWMGNDDRSREGGTNRIDTLVNDADAEVAASMEHQRQIEEQRQAPGMAHNAFLQNEMRTMANTQTKDLTEGGPGNITQPELPKVNQEEANLNAERANKLRQQAFTDSVRHADAVRGIAYMPELAPPSPSGTPPSTAPATPAPPTTTPNVTATGKSKTEQEAGTTQSFQGQIKTGQTNASMESERDQYARTLTNVTNAQNDEIKTDVRKLYGLSAFQDAINAYGGMTNYESGMKGNVYADMAKRRQDDLQRWETAETTSGSQSVLTKIGTAKDKLGSSSTTSEASGRDFQRSTVEIKNDNSSTLKSSGPADPNAGKATLGSLTGREGTDFVTQGDTRYWKSSISTADIATRYKDKDLLQLETKDGKGGILDELQRTYNPTTNPRAKGSTLEVMSRVKKNDGKYEDVVYNYDYTKKKYINKKTKQAIDGEPPNIAHVRTWNPDGSVGFTAQPEGLTNNNAPEWGLAPLVFGRKGVTSPNEGANTQQ